MGRASWGPGGRDGCQRAPGPQWPSLLLPFPSAQCLAPSPAKLSVSSHSEDEACPRPGPRSPSPVAGSLGPNGLGLEGGSAGSRAQLPRGLEGGQDSAKGSREGRGPRSAAGAVPLIMRSEGPSASLAHGGD